MVKSGILLIDKPQGITSHDVVDIVRRKFNIKRVEEIQDALHNYFIIIDL